MIRRCLLSGGLALLASPALAQSTGIFNVRDFGARGDGATLDTDAIRAAVKAAHAAGGGTVLLPAGRYLSFSIRLLDKVTLWLGEGCVLEAADPDIHKGAYDLAETDWPEQFQDFGITQFHCSLIYADGARDVAVIGRGLIHGKGLRREDPGARWHGVKDWQPGPRLNDPKEQAIQGQGIRAIGFKNSRNVLVRDVTVLQGGHFSVHLLGCTNATIENVMVDTDRDGIDIDCCRDVRVRDCIVNAPKDDAIVLKSSYALNEKIITENVLVTGCKTSGFAMGSVLDGTYKPSDYSSTDGIGVLGRIKLGTESNGGFRNILISDCQCDTTRGILMGVVDGGVLEDVLVSNITLRNPVNHPLFVRQAARLRGPKGIVPGACRRVAFSNIHVTGANGRYPCGVAGIADAPVEDVTFRDIHVMSGGGGTAEDASREVPYRREISLEVTFMGALPAFGFYARHANNISLRDVTFETTAPDARPAMVFDSVQTARVTGMVAPVRTINSSGITLDGKAL
ncbi:glycoside hydrolase [Asticcacaulis sp. AC460]|uniref:rhamnogalacturonidase n=1 Tax=Asticcacaulis sp. AC460 TaxID=1282360 RepID=UPI0003C3B9E4|nr:glycosyl hydrolase family 28-related protein [Asticcacaulis sp. AC460]ESQ88269.1 glycoside hydrolase [Asticcacaulis sp. AC460]